MHLNKLDAITQALDSAKDQPVDVRLVAKCRQAPRREQAAAPLVRVLGTMARAGFRACGATGRCWGESRWCGAVTVAKTGYRVRERNRQRQCAVKQVGLVSPQCVLRAVSDCCA